MAQADWIYGIHALQTLLDKQPERIMEVFIQKGRNDQPVENIVNLSRKFGISIQFVQRKVLDTKTENAQHQGVVARAKPSKLLDEHDLESLVENSDNAFILVLDGVTDPHNLGACLRTADAAGVDAVVVPKDKSVKITPVVRKVACGAADVVPLVAITNLSRTLNSLKNMGVWVVGTAGEATDTLFSTTHSGPVALVMGAEGKGMRRLTRENCDQLVKLPMAGTVSSLNVSVATGICLYELVRQRQP